MFTGNHEATGGCFPTQIRTKAKQRFPENVKWLRFLPVALRNEALSRSKKHDGGSSEFWQVYFHRSGDGDGTRCPRTVRAFTEVSPRRHQIAPFDAFPTISIATFSAGGPWHRLAQRPFRKPAFQACHRKPDFPSLVFV